MEENQSEIYLAIFTRNLQLFVPLLSVGEFNLILLYAMYSTQLFNIQSPFTMYSLKALIKKKIASTTTIVSIRRIYSQYILQKKKFQKAGSVKVY